MRGACEGGDEVGRWGDEGGTYSPQRVRGGFGGWGNTGTTDARGLKGQIFQKHVITGGKRATHGRRGLMGDLRESGNASEGGSWRGTWGLAEKHSKKHRGEKGVRRG